MKRLAVKSSLGLFALCALCVDAANYGTRKDYTLPFRVGKEYIPIQATISCQSWEINKTFAEISNEDPGFLLFAKNCVQACINDDIEAVKDAVIYESSATAKYTTKITEVPSFYQEYKSDDITIQTAVFVEDYVYIFCRADKRGEQKILHYLIRKKEDGSWGWLAVGYGKLDFVIVPIFKSLEQRVLNENQFVAVIQNPKFTHQTILTPDPNHENFVAINYNAISFEEGVPLFDESGHELLTFLLRYWECKLHGCFADLSVFYDKKSFGKMKGEIERSGMSAESYTTAMQPKLKDEPYASHCLTFAVVADPIVILYERTGSGREWGRVLYKDAPNGEYVFIRHHSFGPVRRCFDKIRVKESSGQ